MITERQYGNVYGEVGVLKLEIASDTQPNDRGRQTDRQTIRQIYRPTNKRSDVHKSDIKIKNKK